MNIETIAYELGYRVSEDGKLINPKGEIIKGCLRHSKRKYTCLAFTIKVGNKTKHCCIHRLQAYQKYKEAIYGMRVVVRHLDGNSFNNSFDNITIGSYSDNFHDMSKDQQEKVINNLHKNRYRKYTDDLIKEVYKDYCEGLNRTQLSTKYNIPVKNIYYIVKKYKHD